MLKVLYSLLKQLIQHSNRSVDCLAYVYDDELDTISSRTMTQKRT
ncbi:hypothetical protein P7266_0717 [Lactococcus cremoris]|nr:hypothetical protein P7266_0717 [Lactococcus cremoris]